MASKGLALVTGASNGIGYHMAQQLAQDGYDLVIAGKEQNLTAQAEADLKALGVEVSAYAGDLSQYEACTNLWRKVEQTGRTLDVACLNAGLGVGGDFLKTSLEQELEVVYVNCASTVILAKHVAKQMAGKGGGRILITASIVSEMLGPGESVYGASKAFTLQFAKNLRFELADKGISVTALQPGPVDTNFFENAGSGDTKVGAEGKKENQPDEVARQGLKAMFAGEEHVYAASLKTKLEGAVMGLVPDAVQAKMHKGFMEPANK